MLRTLLSIHQQTRVFSPEAIRTTLLEMSEVNLMAVLPQVEVFIHARIILIPQKQMV